MLLNTTPENLPNYINLKIYYKISSGVNTILADYSYRNSRRVMKFCRLGKGFWETRNKRIAGTGIAGKARDSYCQRSASFFLQ
ncbi:MAG: hypothetical protein B6D35_13995 [Candidatus Brocadia sp. UTAMX2]|nr:MAG: hypothetical protein B6D35_13995 [Candidatus Brocadia sp. UTAMX2]